MFDPFDEKKNALILHYAVNGMTKHFDALRERFPDPGELYEAVRGQDAALASEIPEKVRLRLLEAASDDFTERLLESLDRIGCDVVVKGGEGYPALLNEIDLAPNLLFVKGTLPAEPMLPVAVIGSRKSTEYGRHIAETFSYGLREAGALIVSGLAYGIDSAAAKGALESDAEGPATVAVLGTGIDIVYPAQNRALYEKIAERGAVVSEFWPGTKPRRESFPARNRIISGLSKGVLVVEAAERSGTSHTVGFAHDQGREVFAVPGRITDVMSAGTNRMIRNGEAKPVFCIEDILEEFPGCSQAQKQPERERLALSALDNEAQRILRALAGGETDADTLSERTGMAASALNAKLTVLSFSGIVTQMPGRVFGVDADKIDMNS